MKVDKGLPPISHIVTGPPGLQDQVSLHLLTRAILSVNVGIGDHTRLLRPPNGRDLGLGSGS